MCGITGEWIVRYIYGRGRNNNNNVDAGSAAVCSLHVFPLFTSVNETVWRKRKPSAEIRIAFTRIYELMKN